jgi:hypothetical protein
MTTTAHTIRARKQVPCQGYRCRAVIERGELYVRCVAFPDDEVNQGPRPWVLKICQACNAPRPMPPFRVYRARTTATGVAS